MNARNITRLIVTEDVCVGINVELDPAAAVDRACLPPR